MRPKKVSVILSTYNRPKALFIVLSCLCLQDDDKFEIIVADDGSDVRTAEVVKTIQTSYPNRPIQHVWQEKKGFRLARIRNLAVKKATGDYLVFLDGDCVPPPDFIKNHRSLAETGWAVYGQRILASENYTKSLETVSEVLCDHNFWKFNNFVSLYIHHNINRVLPILSFKGNSWRKLKPHNWPNIRGCNWAIWVNDYLAINGSDETFEGWGAEDKDVAVRLINSGIRLKDGRYKSFVLHLWHPFASRERNSEQTNIVNSRFANKTIFPNKGINN